MGYICAKFQVSSFNGLSVKMSRTYLCDGLVNIIKGRWSVPQNNFIAFVHILGHFESF